MIENDENIYRINLKSALTASNLIYDLSTYLDKEEVKNKKILLQLSDIDLNIAQLKSIRSLINSINSSLSFISTDSESTKYAAMALEIVITDENTTQNLQQEPEKTYKTLEEVIEEKSDNSEAEEEKSDVISIETEEFTTKDAQNALESIFDEEPFPDKDDKKEVETEAVNEETEEQEAAEVPENTNNEEDSQNIENSEDTETDEPKEEKEDISPLDSIFGTENKLETFAKVNEIPEEETPLDVEYYKNLDNEFTEDDLEIDNLPTMYIKHTLRSGQVVNYEGNVVIIGDCHTGSEIHATGDITVWGVLNGIAHAGSAGNTRAKIRALKMNAIQLRISDSYARKPDVLNTVLMEKTNVFTPEEARCIDGDIIIFKIND